MGMWFTINFYKECIIEDAFREKIDDLNVEYHINKYEHNTAFIISTSCEFNNIHLGYQIDRDRWAFPNFSEFGIEIYTFQDVLININGFFESTQSDYENYIVDFMFDVVKEIKEDFLTKENDRLLFYQKDGQIYLSSDYENKSFEKSLRRYFPDLIILYPNYDNTEMYELGSNDPVYIEMKEKAIKKSGGSFRTLFGVGCTCVASIRYHLGRV